jgi:hypothetical protein
MFGRSEIDDFLLNYHSEFPQTRFHPKDVDAARHRAAQIPH